MFGDLFSPSHIIILLAIALLIFGPRRLPEIGSGLGRGIQEFRAALTRVNLTSPGSSSDGAVTSLSGPPPAGQNQADDQTGPGDRPA